MYFFLYLYLCYSPLIGASDIKTCILKKEKKITIELSEKEKFSLDLSSNKEMKWGTQKQQLFCCYSGDTWDFMAIWSYL